MLGFQFSEVMTGTYTRVGHPDQQGTFRFSGKVTAPRMLRHLRDGMTTLEGTLDMEGFADDVPIRGTVEIAILTKKIIRYEFNFVGNDGQPYRFAGQKDIRFADLKTTMTTLHGAILDGTGNEVARVTAHFDLRQDLGAFLASWKPALAL